MRLASLAMYSSHPPLVAATRMLWAYIRNELQLAGVHDVPDGLDEGVDYDEAWLRPDLLLSQTCGFPYVKLLRGKVRLVATPAYGLPGCDGPLTQSFIIVRDDSKFQSLQEARGTVAAINDPGSNSGTNLFRAAIASLAHGERFFSSVVETGSHLASIDAVAAGAADIASIDCVTFGNTNRFEPSRLRNIRVLAKTGSGPGLPFVTAAGTSDAELTVLRQTLAAIADAPALVEIRDTLSLRRFELLSDADYQRLADLERQAIAIGYPTVA